MSRRPGSKVVTVERPRQKGWWGCPETDQLEADEIPGDAPPREPLRRAAEPRQARKTVAVGRALTPNQIDAIRAVMRLFIDDDLGRGLDPHTTLYCDRCESAQPAAGSVRYGRFTFCNGCSTEFEIARGRGLIEHEGEFMDRAATNARSA
jgi:hypothetical protein